MKDKHIEESEKKDFLSVFTKESKSDQDMNFLMDKIKKTNLIENAIIDIQKYKVLAEKDLLLRFDNKNEGVMLLKDFFELMFKNKLIPH